MAEDSEVRAMRFPKRTDLDNELQRVYVGADDFEYAIHLPIAVYSDPDNADLELVMDSTGAGHLVPKIGGRTAMICRVTLLPGTDEPLT